MAQRRLDEVRQHVGAAGDDTVRSKSACVVVHVCCVCVCCQCDNDMCVGAVIIGMCLLYCMPEP